MDLYFQDMVVSGSTHRLNTTCQNL